MKDDQRRTSLLTEERRQQILAFLEREGRVFATELSHRYHVSDDTIRPDLDALADSGMVQRVHGGALRRATFTENFEERQAESTVAKDTIAKVTVSLLQPGQ